MVSSISFAAVNPTKDNILSIRGELNVEIDNTPLPALKFQMILSLFSFKDIAAKTLSVSHETS